MYNFPKILQDFQSAAPLHCSRVGICLLQCTWDLEHTAVLAYQLQYSSLNFADVCTFLLNFLISKHVII